MDLSADAEGTISAWNEICEQFSVPRDLHSHQVDTMSLLIRGENIFCGVPTGSGKTLAQLATVLITNGKIRRCCSSTLGIAGRT